MRQKLCHDPINALMRIKREVFREQLGRGVRDGDRVKQHGSEHGHLGLHRGGHTVVHRGGHGECGHGLQCLLRALASLGEATRMQSLA